MKKHLLSPSAGAIQVHFQHGSAISIDISQLEPSPLQLWLMPLEILSSMMSRLGYLPKEVENGTIYNYLDFLFLLQNQHFLCNVGREINRGGFLFLLE